MENWDEVARELRLLEGMALHLATKTRGTDRYKTSCDFESLLKDTRERLEKSLFDIKKPLTLEEAELHQ